ncbi:MAG: PIG-L family deacetylase [Candidatus Brennerbacteria bacterium CG_4_8_14_3_um_filter_43_14]|uniref:PIG-L family deacetylase n=1 Tax=Candidatus Brennerbacteria bacterium CG_4_8_14_3_um_filter_43_14 TaxID=1974521 RepID=A0A2H9N4P1_9BACT|nr:MAG: PIG-L family deacetylase [Candidatus Brennerbacteria bacterium CG_4_8_14_3_um_filter_43_14]PJA19583.1 MAG: PIG-L family deacetylase [Candidatus Brennerbacteria bacterium CG_4_10_14_0_2_um_filter_43_14]
MDIDKKDQFDFIFKDVKKVLVVMAHPDDLEIICGGTVARLTATGRRVRSVVMTNGGKGMQDRTDITEEKFGKLRVKEQMAAAKELGIPNKESFNLNILDGELEASVENIEKIVFHIRQFKPDIVITHNPKLMFVKYSKTSRWVNHRDHRNAGVIAWDAVYPYSRDRGFFPRHFIEPGLTPHIVNYILFSEAYQDESQVYFDITDFAEKRRSALLQYKSSMTEKDVNDLMDEIRYGDRYFEPLGYTDKLF